MAKKKIFDIIPPTVSRQNKAVFQSQPAKTKLGIKRRGALILASVGIFISVITYLSLNPQAKIEIFLNGELLSFKDQISLEKGVNALNFDEKVIPAGILDVAKSLTKEFLATGRAQKEEKAKGKITIYNGYSTTPQPLLAGTRFISAQGQLFRSPNRLSVPGGSYEKGKLVPGSVEIEVVADEPGEEYNIGPSTFSIPGFVGNPRYTAIYAKSFSSMSGGVTKEVSTITNDDIEKAKTLLKEEIIENGKLDFKNSLADGLSLLEDSLSLTDLKTISAAEVGKEAESFSLQLTGKLRAFTFSESDLNEITLNLVQNNVSQNQYVRQGSVSVNYSLESFDLQKGQAKLSLSVFAALYPKLDDSVLRFGIQEKDIFQAQNYILEQNSSILAADIKIRPFWIMRLPKSQDRINIEIRLEKVEGVDPVRSLR